MKELKFITGQSPKGFKSDFESFLFNEDRHRQLQSETDWHSCHFLREDKKKIMASVHFAIHDGIAYSPRRAPFGSVEVSERLNARDLFEFLNKVELHARELGAKRIQIKNPPGAYRKVTPVLAVLLFNLHYHVVRAEIASTISVGKTSYEKKIQAWELRKLKQGKKAKLSFQELPISEIDKVYDFIQVCRKERQQSLSMSLAELRQAIAATPGHFILFGVRQGKELAAASVSIRVSKTILYNFYSAHPRKFDSLSPVVSLIQGMYVWCQKHHIELIDLGTSALKDQPNFDLLDFKIRLGSNLSPKLTFEKVLV